jgi:hypothetical protein
MYSSLGLDTGPVHYISAYLDQLALGSIFSPRLIGVQAQGDRRGLTGVALDMDWGGENQIASCIVLSVRQCKC